MNSKPNFVFIMVDTQSVHSVGAYGYADVQTPNLDGLAKRGTLFERAYTTSPLCTPARAGIFTGIYPHSAGAWSNNVPLGDNVRTMGQRFQSAGYQTAYVGKWHLDAHDYFGTGRAAAGWDSKWWYDGRNYVEDLSDSDLKLWRQGLHNRKALEENKITAEFTWGHRVTDRALAFLKQAGDKPFVLALSYDEPHHPFTCPPEFANKFKGFFFPLGKAGQDDLHNKPSHQKEWAKSRFGGRFPDGYRQPLYFGCNSFIDSEIGRVLDEISKSFSDNTYVIYTADHGEMMGAHQLLSKGPASYDHITRIPLLIQQPAGRGAGQRCGTLVSHVDILPTMLEAAGVDIPPILDGHSLESLLDPKGGEEDRTVFVEYARYEVDHDSWGGFQPMRCVLRGNHKLVINLLHEDELYDMKTDPDEVDNLIQDSSSEKIRNDLHDVLLKWMDDRRDPFRGPAWARRPWRKDRDIPWWGGPLRLKPHDGFSPEVLDYFSGKPPK